MASAVMLGIMAVWAVANTPLANGSPSKSGPPRSELADERDRLGVVRELLARRAAYRDSLQQQLEALDQQLAALRERRERSERAIERNLARAARLEFRLDHVVPRLGARAATLEDRRVQAARALSGLAGLSRSVTIDPKTRARLLAVSPVMLKRLQAASASVAGLREDRDAAIAQHQELRRQASILVAERERWERARARAQRRHDLLAVRRDQISRTVAALEQEQAQLALSLLLAESAQQHLPEPQAGQPAPSPSLVLEHTLAVRAAVKGAAVHSDRLAQGAQAVESSASRVVAALLPDAGTAQAGLPIEPGMRALRPPPVKPVGMVRKGGLTAVEHIASSASRGLGAKAEVAGPQAADPSMPAARVVPARLERPDAPIMPLPGEVIDRFAGKANKAGITIIAAPGQAVAAPDAGEVVFAERFKDYGLLLMIEHQPDYHTVLWGFSRLDAKVGDLVRTGQVVGVMPSDVAGPELNVELRHNGQLVNPLPWLAANNGKVRG